MSDSPTLQQRIAKAREQADLARMRFLTQLRGTQQRIAPSRLKDDALVAAGDKVDAVKADLKRSVTQHPVLAAGAAAGSIALLFWKPARRTALVGLRVAQFIWLNRKLWSTGK